MQLELVTFSLDVDSDFTMKNQIKKASASDALHRKNNNSTSYHNTSESKKLQPGRELTPHHQECLELLPSLRGWERIFINQLLTQPTLNVYQREKLNLIKKNNKETRRCRYCMDRVSVLNEDYYFCDRCGGCLNLEFASSEITGGAIDA